MDGSPVARIRALIAPYVKSWRLHNCTLGAYAACADVDEFLVALETGPVADAAREAAAILRRLGYPEKPLTGSLTLTLTIEQMAALARLAPPVEPSQGTVEAPAGNVATEEDPEPVQALARHLRLLVDYARWQMTEGSDHHPTLPSAVAAASSRLKKLGLDQSSHKVPQVQK
jgi:hypothetical protein